MSLACWCVSSMLVCFKHAGMRLSRWCPPTCLPELSGLRPLQLLASRRCPGFGAKAVELVHNTACPASDPPSPDRHRQYRRQYDCCQEWFSICQNSTRDACNWHLHLRFKIRHATSKHRQNIDVKFEIWEFSRILGNLPPLLWTWPQSHLSFSPSFKIPQSAHSAPLPPFLAFISSAIIIFFLSGGLLCPRHIDHHYHHFPGRWRSLKFQSQSRSRSCSNRPTLPCRDFGAITIFSTTIISAPTTLK